MRLDHEGHSARDGAIAAGLALALAGLVALASQHAHVWTLPLRAGSVDRAAILVRIAVLSGVGLIAATAIAMVVHRAWMARRPGPAPLRATLLRALPPTAAALAVASLLLIARTDPGPRAEPGQTGGSGTVAESSDRRGVPLSINWWTSNVRAGEGEPNEEAPGGPANRSTSFSPLLIVVGAVMTAIAGLAAWRSYRRRGPEDFALPDDTRQEAVHGALVSTIDAMLADPDPNTAIRGAYARLLEGLDACGTGRRDHEAPMEHLRRVFTVLDVRPGPVRRLTELFEVARFSTRPLSPAHRDQALAALRDVATDLQSDLAARPGPAGARPLTEQT